MFGFSKFAMHQVDMITVGLLLLVACLVAIATRRVGFPYSVGLVIAGIGLNIAGYRDGIELTPDLIFTPVPATARV
jgi:monovalent cation:H+ antiporter, CPA1 family